MFYRRLVDGQEPKLLDVIHKDREWIVFKEHQEAILGLAQAALLKLVFFVELQDDPRGHGELTNQIKADEKSYRMQLGLVYSQYGCYRQQQQDDSIAGAGSGHNRGASRSLPPSAHLESGCAIKEGKPDQRLPWRNPDGQTVCGQPGKEKHQHADCNCRRDDPGSLSARWEDAFP